MREPKVWKFKSKETSEGTLWECTFGNEITYKLPSGDWIQPNGELLLPYEVNRNEGVLQRHQENLARITRKDQLDRLLREEDGLKCD